MKRDELAARGREAVLKFCEVNDLKPPKLVEPRKDAEDRRLQRLWHVDSCGFYRDNVIHVMPDKCSNVGRGGPAWSWPGYVIDRTPFGVYAHELGHYVDEVLTKRLRLPGRFGYSYAIWGRTREEKVSGYCPNASEWFAECFRVFVTNPSFLRLYRPRTFDGISNHFKPIERRYWRDVLAGAPARTIAMAERKLGCV